METDLTELREFKVGDRVYVNEDGVINDTFYGRTEWATTARRIVVTEIDNCSDYSIHVVKEDGSYNQYKPEHLVSEDSFYPNSSVTPVKPVTQKQQLDPVTVGFINDEVSHIISAGKQNGRNPYALLISVVSYINGINAGLNPIFEEEIG